MAELKLVKETYTREEVQAIVDEAIKNYVETEYYTLEDIQTILNIKRVQCRALIHTEGFPLTRIGRYFRVNIKAFEQWQIDNMCSTIELPTKKKS